MTRDHNVMMTNNVTGHVKAPNNQVYLIELLAGTNKIEIYASNQTIQKEAHGIDFKGQLLNKTQLKEIDENLTFEIEIGKQKQLFIPWHRVLKVRNVTFERKEKLKGVQND